MISDESTSSYVFQRESTRNTGGLHEHFKEYDLRNTQSIEESVRHSDVVYNLVGRQYPTKLVEPYEDGLRTY